MLSQVRLARYYNLLDNAELDDDIIFSHN